VRVSTNSTPRAPSASALKMAQDTWCGGCDPEASPVVRWKEWRSAIVAVGGFGGLAAAGLLGRAGLRMTRPPLTWGKSRRITLAG